MNNLYLYIPTRGRVAFQKTWDWLPLDLRKRTKIVCPLIETFAHEKEGRAALACPANKDKGMCLAETRDWILDFAEKHGQSKIAIFDDDITLLVRQPLVKGKLPRFLTSYAASEWREAVNWLENALDNYAHAAWGMRQHHWDFQTNLKDEVKVGRALGCCMAFHVKKVRKAGATFTSGMPKGSPMSDFNMTLQLLRAGEPNLISLVYRASPDPPNRPGGCFGYRTAKLQSETAKRLHKLYPNFVDVVEKKAWKGMSAEKMFDVRVYWKRALGAKRGE